MEAKALAVLLGRIFAHHYSHTVLGADAGYVISKLSWATM
jgi:hypothetical protein